MRLTIKRFVTSRTKLSAILHTTDTRKEIRKDFINPAAVRPQLYTQGKKDIDVRKEKLQNNQHEGVSKI